MEEAGQAGDPDDRVRKAICHTIVVIVFGIREAIYEMKHFLAQGGDRICLESEATLSGMENIYQNLDSLRRGMYGMREWFSRYAKHPEKNKVYRLPLMGQFKRFLDVLEDLVGIRKSLDHLIKPKNKGKSSVRSPVAVQDYEDDEAAKGEDRARKMLKMLKVGGSASDVGIDIILALQEARNSASGNLFQGGSKIPEEGNNTVNLGEGSTDDAGTSMDAEGLDQGNTSTGAVGDEST